MQLVVLSREDIDLLHDFILSVSPGRRGILHKEVIEAALQRPYTYMQYREVDLHTLAALYIDSFGRNHAFSDGNKRTALMCGIYTYAMNGTYLKFSNSMNQDFENLVLWVVKEKPEINEIRAQLDKLTENHKLGSFNKFMFHMKDFFN